MLRLLLLGYAPWLELWPVVVVVGGGLSVAAAAAAAVALAMAMAGAGGAHVAGYAKRMFQCTYL